MTPRKAGSESQFARDEKAVTDHVTRGVVSDGGRTSPPVSASNTRADNPPAPPPCEECAWYLTHTDIQHAKALHAEIAQLRARIEGLAKEWDVGSWNVGGNARDAARRLRAALAPKEGT